jgi:hypothetical protein
MEVFLMVKQEAITITVSREVMDIIRKQAQASYRSINKHIQYLIDKAINEEK